MAPPPSPQASCGTVVAGQEKNWAAPAPWQRVFSAPSRGMAVAAAISARHQLPLLPIHRARHRHAARDRLCRGSGHPQSDAGAACELDGERLPNGDRAEQGAGRPLRPVRARALLGPAAAGAGESQAMAGHPPGFRRAIRRCGRSHAGHQPGRRDLLSRWRGGAARAARPAVDRLFRPHRGARREGRKAGERRRAGGMLQDRLAEGMARRLAGPGRRHDPRPVLGGAAQARPVAVAVRPDHARRPRTVRDLAAGRPRGAPRGPQGAEQRAGRSAALAQANELLR